jgi:glycosyltransferase involved in cell wall biosynthesis
MRRTRLGIVVTHPIQYQIPLFRHLADGTVVEPIVFFLSEHGLSDSYDDGFGRAIKYDVPLLGGYEYRIIRNCSPKPNVGTSLGIFNPTLPPYIRKANVEALLVHGYSNVSHWLAYTTAYIFGIPYFLRGESRPDRDGINSVKKLVKRALLRPLIQNASACLAIGDDNRKFYTSYGASPDRIFFSPYSVDTNRFSAAGSIGRTHRGRMLSCLGLESNIPLVLFAAKLQPWKRPIDLVIAMDRLRYPANLIVIGDGPLRPDLERMASTRPWMRTLGFVNQEKIAEWYGATDLFVLPSHHEPWGLAVNEAMAAGAVPIVSDSIGCGPDLVTRDVGWVYATGDVEALAGAIEEGCRPGALDQRRAAAQQRSAEYGIAVTARGIEEATASVLR